MSIASLSTCLVADLRDADERGVRVLHLDAPALHRAEAVAESGARLRLVVLLRLGLVQERAHLCGGAVSDWDETMMIRRTCGRRRGTLTLNFTTLIFANLPK